MKRHWSLVIGHWSFVCVWSLVLGHWSFAADVAGPLSPGDAQKAFQLADSSIRIELAAAEPEVVDPVAIRFDEDGRMWVVEMRDYPLGNPAGGEPLSRIRVLEDKDGDGRFETSSTFADKLLFVTGLQPWKGGVFVTLSGRLAYMKDTDGDGRADVDETWFTGFAELNTQLRANHPRLALDNWIYVANGLRGGKVVNKKLGETEPINISGMDFRFDPLTGKAEAVTGNGQFGLCFDDWGNRFNCSNRNPVRHVVIEDRYLKANPGVTVPATVNDVAAWGEQSRIFPVSRAWTTSNLHAGQFTAACGVYIYRGDLLPPEFKGNVFTCDPTGNLIHREIMQPAGPTFTSKAAYEGKEFLASPDEWFRPVNMELGPDGALYVVDMYRCVIEHPDFVPDELKRRPDLRLGDDRGRIWRIVSADTSPKRQRGIDAPLFSKTSSDDLLPLLDHPNAWQRETAQRLMLQKRSPELFDRLRKVVRDGNSPQSRIAAQWLLSSETVFDVDVLYALDDPDPQVRRQGLIVAEGAGHVCLTPSNPSVLALLIDPDPSVRFQARLFTLIAAPRHTTEPATIPAELWGITFFDADNPWLRRSALLSLNASGALDFFKRWKGTPFSFTRLTQGQIQLLEEVAAQSATVSPEVTAETGGWALGLIQPEIGLAIERGLIQAPRARQSAIKSTILDPASPRLLEIANDSSQSLPNRTSAVGLLAYTSDAAAKIKPFASRQQPQVIRIAAIGALARQPDAGHWDIMINEFSTNTPPVRKAMIDALLANGPRTKLLLDAIEAGQIKTSEIDAAQVKRLVESRDAAIKERAGKIFAAALPADRAKALVEYQPVLSMKGDPKNGQVVFEKNCAACHRIAGIGVNVAPDISDSRTKKPEQLLADILQPNRAIDNNYVGYSVRQLDGMVLTGILTAETATSITLRQQGGKDAVIPRTEIDELRSSGQSLMPDGLERNIPPQDMADLLSFIKNWRYLDGRTPLSAGNN